MFSEFDVIHSYTRKQAIEDGVLIDVSTVAAEAGFKCPVAITQGVHETCVRVPQGVVGQDEAGRLWDILWMLRHADFKTAHLREHGAELGVTVRYELHLRNDNSEGDPPLVTLKVYCGPGDEESEPLVLTIMLPEED